MNKKNYEWERGFLMVFPKLYVDGECIILKYITW